MKSFKIGDKVVNITAGEFSSWASDLPLYTPGEIVGVDGDGDFVIEFNEYRDIQYLIEESEVVLECVFNSPLYKALS